MNNLGRDEILELLNPTMVLRAERVKDEHPERERESKDSYSKDSYRKSDSAESITAFKIFKGDIKLVPCLAHPLLLSQMVANLDSTTFCSH